MHHIRATLPDIKARIQQQLQKYNAELQTLGGAMGDSNSVRFLTRLKRANSLPRSLLHHLTLCLAVWCGA